MDIPVLIVGAGPAGLCTSIALSRMGVRSILIERHAGTSVYPKATGISLRTMELLRQWGLDRHVRAESLKAIFVNSVRESTLASREVDELTLGYPTAEQSRVLSAVAPAVCAQDVFEPILLEAARSYDLARVLFDTELTSLRQEGDAVFATVVNRDTGVSRVIQARYVVGADGYNSAVRRELGVQAIGPSNVGEYLSVLFRAELTHLVGATVRGMYSVTTPHFKGMLFPTSTDGRWFLATPWGKERPPADQFTTSELHEFVHAAIGDESVEVRLLGHNGIVIGAQVAERFRDRNVFLVGDAAHRMTPTGGIGLNTAIQSAHNLAWKIGAVLQGWAGVGLLDTYETERRVVGERNVARSIGQWKEKSGLALDLGVVYHSKAVVREADCDADNIVEPFCPAQLGGRVPHVALSPSCGRTSTIDVSGSCLTLIAPREAQAWIDGMVGASRALHIPLEVMTFEPPATHEGREWLWANTFGISADCAVLVRPDGHIAWITPSESLNVPALCADAIARVVDGMADCARAIGTTKMHAVQRPDRALVNVA